MKTSIVDKYLAEESERLEKWKKSKHYHPEYAPYPGSISMMKVAGKMKKHEKK